MLTLLLFVIHDFIQTGSFAVPMILSQNINMLSGFVPIAPAGMTNRGVVDFKNVCTSLHNHSR